MLKNTFKDAPQLKKTAYLYAAILFNTLLGFVATKLNTHYLTLEDFGRLNFFIVTLTFAQNFMSFGVFESASRRIAIESSLQKIRELNGVTVLFSVAVGLFFAIIIYIWSFFTDSFFEVTIGGLLRSYAPLAFVLLWQSMLLILLRGSGDIPALAMFTFSPRLLYVAGLIYIALSSTFSLNSTLLFFLLSILLISPVFVFRLRPVFTAVKENLKILREETLSFGRHLYVANLISGAIMHADKFFVAYFLDARQLGLYTLAFTLSVPLLHFSTAVSRSHYHEFANSSKISTKVLKTNLFFQISGVTALIVLGKPIITYIFSADYLPGIQALFILAVAFGVSGLSIPYTSFLKAHGRGKEIRNITIQVHVLLVALNVLLIPLWGINGAALAVLIIYLYDLIAYVTAYRKLVKRM
ncbi:MAG TPA: hypothetical protein EYP36_04915 [Calditrichaeota bacterium]|nr:hypothetical protein [Calditrichota bacterium]